MDGEILKQVIGIPFALLIFWAVNPITWVYYGIKSLLKKD